MPLGKGASGAGRQEGFTVGMEPHTPSLRNCVLRPAEQTFEVNPSFRMINERNGFTAEYGRGGRRETPRLGTR